MTFMLDYMLSLIIFFPLFACFIIGGIPSRNVQLIRWVGLFFSGLTMFLSVLLFIFFDKSIGHIQFLEEFKWLYFFNFSYTMGVDGVSLLFICLTTFLLPICLFTYNFIYAERTKEYFIAFLVLESLLVSVFSVFNLLLFYMFFESVLIPMFLIIGIWGSRHRKIYAAYQLVLYTIFGSIFFLIGIFVLYYAVGSLDYYVLKVTQLSFNRQLLLWFCFFMGFAVKVPMVPFHIWLPEAHVEAPTAGSVILAGILLKLGTFGFLRYSIPLFPQGTLYFIPLVYVLSIFAIVYTSLTTLRQIDLKKIIAYSSVAHMGFVTIGLFSLTSSALEGSIFLMLSHGFISSALFLCVGVVYDRYKTRIYKYYSNLVLTMPLFAMFFLFFSLANLSFPGTSSFIGEFFILLGVFQLNSFIASIAAVGTILGAAYVIWLYNRVVFGISKIYYLGLFSDMSIREIYTLFPLFFCAITIGVFPELFLDNMHLCVSDLLLLMM